MSMRVPAIRLSYFVSFALLLLFAYTSFAQTPISPSTWTGSPASATGPSGFTTLPATTTPGAATIAVSQWNRAGVTYNTAGACYNSKDWEVGGSLSSAIANNKYIYFTVVNSATTELQISRLYIASQVSSTGPHNVQMMYTMGTTTATFGAATTTTHSATPENWTFNDKVCVQPGQTITFKLYGWGGTNTAGTLRINDGTAMAASFATPVTATASSNSPICAGTTLELYGGATGGIPTYNYSWSGPGSFTSTDQNPVILSPLSSASGVYTLTVTDMLECSNSVSPATTTVTVNSAPSAITGVLSVCPMLTTTLSSTTMGGTWSVSDVSIATVGATTGVVTGVASGTTTITYQLGSLCFTTAVVTVNVPPDPISGSSSVCQGLSITLSDATVGGTWLSGNVAVATVVSGTGVVTGVSNGTSVITYTGPTGCIATKTVTVYPFPAAIGGTASVCVGSTTTLTNTSGGGTWSSSDAMTASVDAATGVVTGVTAGTATITYMLGGGCSVYQVVTVNPLPDVITGTLQVCVNSSVSLFNSAPGGTWSSANTTIATVVAGTGVLTGVTAGTVRITYTLPTGCLSTAIITVNPLPNAITGPAAVCVGATVNLATTSTGGTWSSTNTAVATITSGGGVVSGLASGTTTISYTFTSTGCAITRVETVNPLPTTISGSSVVCPGLTITLSSTPAGGAWTSSNTAIATVTSGTGIVTGVAAGTVNITYTLPTTCLTVKTITVNPAPPASISPLGDTTFCPGDFVVLTANTGVGLTYAWFRGATAITGATGNTYVAYASGSYRIRVTNSLGCPWFSVPMTVLSDTVNASITVPGGTTTSCASSPVLLSASPATGHSYQWIMGTTPIPGATDNTYSADVTGSYAVQVINATGCSDTSGYIAVTILPSPATAVTASGSLTFCQGGSVVLTGAIGSGYTYQWYNATGIIAGATSASYTASVSGTYHVDITNTYGCLISSSLVNVVVNPLPGVAITASGPKVFCSGGSVTLGAVAGMQYQWYKNSVAITGATNATFTTNTTGGYRVRVTNPATGCTDMTHADTMVTVITSPDIVALTPKRFCWGGSSLLTTSLSPVGYVVAYQWYMNGTAIPGATNPTINAGATGSYHCTITVPGGCSVSSTTAAVTEMPLPNPVITFDGSHLNTGSWFVTYQWYKDLVAIPGATSSSVTPTGVGSYKVRVTDTNGCQSVSLAYVVNSIVSPPSGVQQLGNTPYRIYPNPTSGIIYIQAQSVARIRVVATDGRIIKEGAFTSTLDLSDMADGSYVLYLFDDAERRIGVEKLTKISR